MRPSPVVIIHAPGSSEVPSRAVSCSRKRRVPVVFSKKERGTKRKVADNIAEFGLRTAEFSTAEEESELTRTFALPRRLGLKLGLRLRGAGRQTISWTAKRLPMESIIWRQRSLKPPRSERSR